MFKAIQKAFVVVGKEGSTSEGEGFIQKLWKDANSHVSKGLYLEEVECVDQAEVVHDHTDPVAGKEKKGHEKKTADPGMYKVCGRIIACRLSTVSACRNSRLLEGVASDGGIIFPDADNRNHPVDQRAGAP